MKFLSLSILLCASSVYGASVHLETLKSIADKVNSLQTTWKANSDLSSHLTTSSFKGLLGALESERKLPVRSHKFTDIEIPEEFDARKQWPNCPTIRQIRDQGNCGSCWAVATAGAFTDRVCIASNGTFTMPLSDEEMLACCEECGYGCKGGYPEDAWNYLSRNGLVTGGGYNTGVGCQPYSIESCEHHTDGDLPPCSSLPDGETPVCRNKCTNEKYGIPFAEDHHRIVAQSAYTLNNDVSEIQKDILLHGPVEATFAVYSDFVTYKSGVYQHVSGTRLGGHAVRLIGWGIEDETPFWLLANSWNPHWGEQGYFKVIRGQNECGIEEGITAGIPIV